MAIPNTENITIYKGSTYRRVARWDTGVPTFVSISNITQNAPAAITAVAHGVPDGWPVCVVSAEGMREINNPTPAKLSSFTTASVVDVDNITLPFVNSASYAAYTSGGFLKFFTPVDLTGYSARMTIRTSWDATTALVELTSSGGDIALDNAAKTITTIIDDLATAAIAVRRGVYDLELESPAGDVYPILRGRVTFKPEATRA